MEKKFLIVGAGLTGSLTAALLKRASLPIVATVWDKAKGAGGRMSTHRDPGSPDLQVDMGAQYVSRTRARAEGGGDREYELLKESLYEELVSNGVLTPFCGCIEGERADLTASVVQNYASPKGLNDIVKHFLVQSGANVSFQRRVTGVCVGGEENRCKVTYSGASQDGKGAEEGKEEALFDGVVLTMPIPQLLQLGGNLLEETSEEIRQNLGSVKYSSRYALGLFFREPPPPTPELGWSAKYFSDPIVRYASWDTLKRGLCPSNTAEGGGGSSSLLLHTGVPFGIQHLEDDKEEVKRLVMERATELIPGLPPPAHDHIVRWRYSQVSQGYPGSPGAVVLSSPSNPLIVATGDGFSGSNFENCIRAGQSAAKAVIEHMMN